MSGQQRRSNLLPFVVVAMLPVAFSACTQTAGTRPPSASPSAGIVASSDPLVLSGVAYTQGDAMTQSEKSPQPPQNADIVAVPAGGAAEPVVSATPLPPSDSTLAMPSVTANEPTASPPPAVPTAPTTTADGYPNINLTPKQPQSKLLTPEERAKLIEELNALAGRPSAGQ